MKYVIPFSCGHTEQVELFGKTSVREKKLHILKRLGYAQPAEQNKEQLKIRSDVNKSL